jgi:hypothetical protein
MTDADAAVMTAFVRRANPTRIRGIFPRDHVFYGARSDKIVTRASRLREALRFCTGFARSIGNSAANMTQVVRCMMRSASNRWNCSGFQR